MSTAELQRINNRRNDEVNQIQNVRTRTYVLALIFLILDFVEPDIVEYANEHKSSKYYYLIVRLVLFAIKWVKMYPSQYFVFFTSVGLLNLALIDFSATTLIKHLRTNIN